MTELQETELELLKQFLLVCEQFKLTYYLVCGSALGAVKYGGFIPWDDDIDVHMPRPDYLKLLQIFDEPGYKMILMLHFREKIMRSSAERLQRCFRNGVFYKIIIQSLNIIFLGVSCATAELHI